MRGTRVVAGLDTTMLEARCESCGEALTSRQHIVADFLIGAHAMAARGIEGDRPSGAPDEIGRVRADDQQ